jgi:hypothetical protein
VDTLDRNINRLLTQKPVAAKAWRGIEPLSSTRADVENLFGPKVVRCGGSACIYDLGEEIVFVLYAKAFSCKARSASAQVGLTRLRFSRFNLPSFKLAPVQIQEKHS